MINSHHQQQQQRSTTTQSFCSSMATDGSGAAAAATASVSAAMAATPSTASTEVSTDLGHVFAKKTFGKPTYCHHCCDKIWGMLSQGFACEVCNFVCHDKCMRSIVSKCTGLQLQLIKNPVAHTWTDGQHIKRHFCCVCRKRTEDGGLSSECEMCNCYVHVDCQDLALADCREASTYVPSLDLVTHKQQHHMREGNLARDAKCAVCRKGCYTAECFSGFRCQWCNLSVHSTCFRQLRSQCDFGVLRKIMLPPNSVTIPRAELPMDMLLNIHTGSIGNEGSRKVSSPSRMTADEREGWPGAGGPGREEDKESEDHLLLRIYDGNSSLRNQISRTASVPKTASVEQIRDIALRRFHICDNRDNYYVTQAPHESGDEEEMLEDPIPLRNVKKPEGKCAQIFLRHRDDPEKATIRVYGGWLRLPCEYAEIVVTGRMCVQDVMEEALDNFGMEGQSWNRYNLIEVSLEKGVGERTVNPQEEMLQLVRNLRKDSLRRYHVLRFYIQEKEDPHDHAVFVANLPPSLSQRQYERILLKLLSVHQEKPSSEIGPIKVHPYFEYGSLVITFNTPKAATAAVLKLQNAMYEEKKLIVLCLPNVQQHMIPADVEPLLVLVNVKSGGCQGTELLSAFRRLLNPFQVFDVLKGGPLVGLYVFRNISKYRILAAGGDGTVGWVLQCLDIAKQDAACFSPPCAVLPLGTGNDLARVLRWGGGYTGEESAADILKEVIEAEEVRLDRWAIVFHEEERSQPSAAGMDEGQNEAQLMSNPEDQTSMIIMNNYFGIGIDADVCLRFHNKRDANPEKFSSRLFNKTQYVKIGLQKAFERNCKDLWKRIELEVDGRPVELAQCEGIIVLNLLSWGSGANPWGTAREEGGFQKPTHYDGLLEVVGITDVSRLGLIQSKLAAGTRIAQGGSIKITTRDEWPVQVDGEPHIQPPGTITILKSALKAKMLKKAKKSRKTASGIAVRAVQSEGSPSNDFDYPNPSQLEIELRAGHGKSTPGEMNSLLNDEEEIDAFL
ncbi:hypothetical protein niasHT_005237 [Heterodera trifolii]|uniref:Diacylglycerol kinase n=1 Tax=Heterodera trifolii TaxID=157864 RepID=A0ABD2LS81_9BILA